ncbi:bifunctional hydroxymethylpyrimidine kinase/phosphomethylpyrimidine kinase [Candidatus Micrarchaeota archaeon]|nr:bifunctional hydroxymethylpyrimidine kinase/phosphomethylpyrimidine kinase [Candidatus Micrarchaeota archaeon]
MKIKFKNSNILLIGDIIIDHYIYGTVDRICPEAPVPVLNCKSEEMFLGGAGIVLTNLLHLGAKTNLVSVAGDDEEAEKLEKLFKSAGASFQNVAIENGRKTTIKTRCVATSPFWQMLMRFDKEVVYPISNTTEQEIILKLDTLLKNADLVVISDYKKGLLTPTLREAIITKAKSNNRKIIVDSKGFVSDYKGADIIAPNRVELCEHFGAAPTNDDGIIRQFAQKLARQMNCKLVVKRSEKGILWIDNGKEGNVPSVAKKIVNVSGAGDVFIASLALATASDYTLEDAVKIANFAAGIAIGRTRPHVTLEDFKNFE